MNISKVDEINKQIDRIVIENLFGDDWGETCFNGMILTGILEHVKSRVFMTLEKEQKEQDIENNIKDDGEYCSICEAKEDYGR